MDRYTYKIETVQYPENPLESCDVIFQFAAFGSRSIFEKNQIELRYLCEENSHRMNAQDREDVEQDYLTAEEYAELIKKYNLAITEEFSTQYQNYILWMDYPAIRKEWKGINAQIKSRAQSYLHSWKETMHAWIEGEVYTATVTDNLLGEDLHLYEPHEGMTIDVYECYGRKEAKEMEKAVERFTDALNAIHAARLEYVTEQQQKAEGKVYIIDGRRYTVRTVDEMALQQHHASLYDEDLGRHYIVLHGTLQFVTIQTQPEPVYA